jgi:hypothetical protein
MGFSSWLRSWIRSNLVGRGGTHRWAGKPGSFRPVPDVLEGRDLPSFAAPTTIPISQPVALVTADVNGDGKPDLIAAISNGVAVMLGQGGGRFASPVWYSTGSGADNTALAVGDLNGDGKLDIVVGNTPNFPVASPVYSGIGLLLNNGNGTFGAPQQYNVFPFGGGPSSLAVGDFNGDGLLDIAAGADGPLDYAAGGNDSVTVVRNYGLIHYTDGSSYFDFTTQTYATPGFAPGPCQVAVGDFNGDGKPDLAVTVSTIGTVWVLPNKGDGSGTFGTEQQFAVGGSPTALAVGDFNSDGKPDLAVTTATTSGTTTSYGLSVLQNLGDGTGTFAAARNYTLGGFATFIAVGDFNKDGKLDIVTTGAEMDVLLNNGDGTFGAAQKVGPAGSQVVVADFNGDGYPDLAQIDGPGGGIDVVLNNYTPPVITRHKK